MTVWARVSERACTKPTYMFCSMNIHVFYDCSDHPTAEHHVQQLVKNHMANVFRRARAFNLLQGRFCTGRTQTAYANVAGRTQMHYAAASGRKPYPNWWLRLRMLLRVLLRVSYTSMHDDEEIQPQPQLQPLMKPPSMKQYMFDSHNPTAVGTLPQTPLPPSNRRCPHRSTETRLRYVTSSGSHDNRCSSGGKEVSGDDGNK